MTQPNSVSALVTYLKKAKSHGVFSTAAGPVYILNPEKVDDLLASIDKDMITTASASSQPSKK